MLFLSINAIAGIKTSRISVTSDILYERFSMLHKNWDQRCYYYLSKRANVCIGKGIDTSFLEISFSLSTKLREKEK